MILYILVILVTSAAAMLVAGRSLPLRQCRTRADLRNRFALVGIFWILFTVSALRFGMGNDYVRYEEIFRRIWGGWVIPTEPGFNVFVKGLQYLFGERQYILFFAIFAFITVLFMLKALTHLSEHFAFSFFLFMVFGYYFNSMNTMRYYLAVAVSLYVIRYVFEKRYFRFVVIVLIAALFHKSVLLVIPLFLLANLKWKWWAATALGLFGASGLLFGNFYLRIILHFYPSYLGTEYLEGGTSYANILRCALVIAFCLFFRENGWRERNDLRMYFRLNVGALILYLCGSFIPEYSRIGTYMTITQIFLLPGVALRVENKELFGGKLGRYCTRRNLAIAGCVIAALAYFAMWLMKADGATLKLLPYKSWIFE